jgi:hypothetical protein
MAEKWKIGLLLKLPEIELATVLLTTKLMNKAVVILV